MQPLKGVKILDLTRLLPGPWCTMLLSDFGAEVIKIEELKVGDPARLYPPFIRNDGALFLNLNRNKKSITLDLKKPEGREIFLQLAKTADVIVEGFRPGVMKRLGVDYETVKKINPGIIYCSISGFGQSGPYENLVGHDINYVGFAGILSITLDANGKPVIPGIQIADLGGGGSMGAIGILMALMARERTGAGQYVDVSMMDGVAYWMSMHASLFFAEGRDPKTEELVLQGVLPCYNIYETRDGKYLTLGALENYFWDNFCRAIDRKDLMKYQMVTGKKKDEICAVLQGIFKTKTRDEWFAFLRDKDVPCGPVNTISEAFRDPQILHRGMLAEVSHPKLGKIKQVGVPIKLSETPGDIRTPPPMLGQHNEEVLGGLGYTKERIEELKKKRVI